MSRKQSRYRRDALLILKPQTDISPMLFKARYIHREGRWCTFAQLEVLYPTGGGSIDCGHVNIARSIVEVHQVLAQSDNHQMVYFVARVGTYWFNGDRRGKLMLERMETVPSVWFDNSDIFERAIEYILSIKDDRGKD